MKRASKSWMAMVAAILLLGILVGVVWARPNDRPRAADITRKVTLAAADFIPADQADDWHNAGAYVSCHSGSCEWVAPVVFPCLPAVTVERIKLHVYDNNGSQNACADVYRAQPAKAAFLFLGGSCSPVAGTTGNPQTFTSEAINQVVRPSQGAFIWLSVRGASIDAYGVTVEYHVNE